MGKSISTTSNTQTPTNSTPATFKAGDAILCPSVGTASYQLFIDDKNGYLSFIANANKYHTLENGKQSRTDKEPLVFHDTIANRKIIYKQPTFAIGDLVLCPSLSDIPFRLIADPYGKRDLSTLTHDGSYYYYDDYGYFISACDEETDDYQPSLFHNTPANGQAINMLYHGAPILQSNQVANDLIHAKNAEIQRLSWFDALFTTIKNDLKSGDTYKAQKLADLGQYLAQDFQHYSEDELDNLQAEQGAGNE